MSLNKNIYTNYIIQILNVGLNFVYSLIIVHQLGAAGYGEFSLFFNSLAFAILLFGCNVPAIMAYFIVNKTVEPGKLLFSAIIFILAGTICIAVLLSFSNGLNLASQIFPGGDNKTLWIFFFAALFCLMLVNQVLAAFLNAHHSFTRVAFFSFLCNAVLIMFWVCIVFDLFTFKMPAFNLIWFASITINVFITLFSIWLILKKNIVQTFWKLVNTSELRLVAGFTLIVYLCNTIQFLNYKMDVWFISYFDGNAQTGVYALALSLSQLIWVLPNVASSVLVNYFRVKDSGNSIKLAMNFGQLAFYLSCITAVILLITYYFALPYLYGLQFTKTFMLCAILFIGTIPFSLSIIIANLNSGIGFVKINLYATIFVFLTGLILDIIVIPKYGIMGAAIVKTIIYNLGLIFQIIVGRRSYKLPWTELFKFPQLRNIMKPDSLI